MSDTPTYSKQVIEIADYILANPEKDNANDVLAKFGGVWRRKLRTFERWLPIAREYNKPRIERQEKARNEALTEQAKESIKKAILSRDERLEILSKIAKGEGRKVGNKLMIPSDTDRSRAIAEMNKMEGDYAPVKSDISIKRPVLNIEVESEALKKVIENL